MSEEDRLKTNNEKVTINDYYYYYLLKCENALNELEKYIGQEWYCFDNESIEFEVARDILDKLNELKEE